MNPQAVCQAWLVAMSKRKLFGTHDSLPFPSPGPRNLVTKTLQCTQKYMLCRSGTQEKKIGITDSFTLAACCVGCCPVFIWHSRGKERSAPGEKVRCFRFQQFLQHTGWKLLLLTVTRSSNINYLLSWLVGLSALEWVGLLEGGTSLRLLEDRPRGKEWWWRK